MITRCSTEKKRYNRLGWQFLILVLATIVIPSVLFWVNHFFYVVRGKKPCPEIE